MVFALWNRRWLNLVILLLAFVALLLSALSAKAQSVSETPFPPPDGTTWGEPLPLGSGEAKAFVTLDEDGHPRLAGISLDEAALSDLPEEPGDGRWDVKDTGGNVIMSCCGHEYILPLPEEAAATPFENIIINWNPTGHPPAGIYDAPHFDLHFYTIPNEERVVIAPAASNEMCSAPNPPDIGGEHPVPVSCETFKMATMPLPEDQLPPGYTSVGEVAPGMGDHLVNLQAPELLGEAPFTYTWIYGAYGGRLIFYEPMITLAYLQEKNEDVCSPIPMPETMPEPGYYPTQYCIRYLPGEEDGAGTYVVSLESFVEY